MGQTGRSTILLIEDDLALAEMLQAYFTAQGYDIHHSALGETGIRLASENPPDLVLLDISLPDIDGFYVCERLRESHRTRHIPVIFFTERNTRMDRLQGLEMGVIDYITKPFDIQEVRLRIRNVLRRATEMILENPVTGLPEGEVVDETLTGLLKKPDGRGILCASLRGLNSFRELYGFVASDDVLRVTGLTLSNAATELGGDQAYCGHLNDNTFILCLPSDLLPGLQARILERIGHSLEYFYPGDNRGPHAQPGERLGLWISVIDAIDQPITRIESLKEHLLTTQTLQSAPPLRNIS